MLLVDPLPIETNQVVTEPPESCEVNTSGDGQCGFTTCEAMQWYVCFRRPGHSSQNISSDIESKSLEAGCTARLRPSVHRLVLKCKRIHAAKTVVSKAIQCY